MADAYIEKGTTYEIDGKVYECLEFLHVKPGKGSAFVRTKLKDVINGGVVERTFNPSKDVLKNLSRERQCSIPMLTETCITSWTTRHSSRFRLILRMLEIA
mgnify:CR=1 FL=1